MTKEIDMSYLLDKYIEWRSSGRGGNEDDFFGDRVRFSRFANLTETIPEFEMRKLSHEYDQRI